MKHMAAGNHASADASADRQHQHRIAACASPADIFCQPRAVYVIFSFARYSKLVFKRFFQADAGIMRNQLVCMYNHALSGIDHSRGGNANSGNGLFLTELPGNADHFI